MSIGLLSIVSIFSVNAQNNPWTQKSDMEYERKFSASGIVGDKIYLIGDRNDHLRPVSESDNLVTEYDPATDTWISKNPIPIEAASFGSAVVDGIIYVIGGLTGHGVPALANVQAYDPSTNTWNTTRTPMPTPRFGLGACVVDGKIYAVGGMTSGSSFWMLIRNTVEIYDPVTDSWSTGASMPTARLWFSTSVVEGKIYAIGGDLLNGVVTSTVEVYDPVADTWTTKTPMPTARAYPVSGVVDGIIYVISGGRHDGNPPGYTTVEAYDPATDTWTTMADMPAARSFACAETFNNKVYVFGGVPIFPNPGDPGEKTVFVYEPLKDLTPLVDQLELNKSFADVENDSICITATLNETEGITLLSEIKAPDQIIIDCLKLFDDGLHNDGDAGDSKYANTWPVTSDDEQHYYVDLQITKEGDDTIMHRINNMASFTTIGPVIFEDISYSSSDSIPNPGDLLKFKVSLRNESSMATAPNVRVRISSTDPMVNVFSDSYFRIGDIESESISTTFSYITIKIVNDCPVNSEIIFTAEIMSEDISYCNENFTIQVVDPISSANEDVIHYEDKIELRNYPNPFSQSTTIRFNLTESGFVTLKLYDFLGREIETLMSDFLDTGDHSIKLNAAGLTEGIFFCRLETGAITDTKKMVLVR